MHALIIEDDFFVADLIEDTLRQAGFTSFSFATNEKEAVEAAEHRRPDLIASDVELAPGSGLDAVQAICSRNVVPVIFVTANSTQVRERCPEAVVIQKPFGASQLLLGVEQVRGQARNLSGEV